MGYLLENTSSFNAESISWMEELLGNMDQLQETALKFHFKLQELFQQEEAPEENKLLRERLEAAANYFTGKLEHLLQLMQQSPAVTDSRLHAKEYNEGLKEVFAQLATKKFLLEGDKDRLDMEAFHQRKKKFVLPPFAVNAYAGASHQRTESLRPVLHQQLRKLRDSICCQKRYAHLYSCRQQNH